MKINIRRYQEDGAPFAVLLRYDSARKGHTYLIYDPADYGHHEVAPDWVRKQPVANLTDEERANLFGALRSVGYCPIGLTHLNGVTRERVY